MIMARIRDMMGQGNKVKDVKKNRQHVKENG